MDRYTVGSQVNLMVTYRKLTDRSLVDPINPVVTISYPNIVTTVNVVPTRISTGQYRWTWSTVGAPVGIYTYIAHGTVNGADQQNDVQQFEIVDIAVAPVFLPVPNTMSIEDMRECAEIYMSAWTCLVVRDEVLVPMDAQGINFMSFWDNWRIPPDADGIEPMITLNGMGVNRVIPPNTVGDYSLTQYGDSVRAVLTFTAPQGPDAIVLATYQRALFRDKFWENNIKRAIRHVYSRLLMKVPDFTQGVILAIDEPWHLVVMCAAKTALINLQTMIAGFGKTVMDNVTVDLSRAHSTIHLVIDDLEQDMDRDFVAWRWKNSPHPRIASRMSTLPGPGIMEMRYAR